MTMIEKYTGYSKGANLPADDLRTAAMFAAHEGLNPSEWGDLVDYVSPVTETYACPVKWSSPVGKGTVTV